MGKRFVIQISEFEYQKVNLLVNELLINQQLSELLT